jgi:hypothetical protein
MARPLLLVLALMGSTALGLFVAVWGVLSTVHAAHNPEDDWAELSMLMGPFIVAVGLVWALAHTCLAVWVVLARHRGQPLAPVGAVSAGAAAAVLSLSLLARSSGTATLGTIWLPAVTSLLVLVAGLAVVLRPPVSQPRGTRLRPAPEPRH